MKKKLLFVVCFLFTINLFFACSCKPQYKFSKVAPNASLVALVKINRYLTFNEIYDEKTPMSMEVEIIETLKGMTKSEKAVVWGDSGALCRPYLSEFKEGEYYFLALYPGEEIMVTKKRKEQIIQFQSVANFGYKLI